MKMLRKRSFIRIQKDRADFDFYGCTNEEPEVLGYLEDYNRSFIEDRLDLQKEQVSVSPIKNRPSFRKRILVSDEDLYDSLVQYEDEESSKENSGDRAYPKVKQSNGMTSQVSNLNSEVRYKRIINEVNEIQIPSQTCPSLQHREIIFPFGQQGENANQISSSLFNFTQSTKESEVTIHDRIAEICKEVHTITRLNIDNLCQRTCAVSYTHLTLPTIYSV
eukprot:TRINITY_DN9012_c0_g2_i5.p1 TRINITY_DN9012_c0_g2~~TRINITY_DN9012_c0_g2_i5.p1  ORF type:complete len:220 (+),score=15.69 TRINITY_DN9012_c0_g2_i5:32-691(+)